MKANVDFKTEHAQGKIDVLEDGHVLCEVECLERVARCRVTLSGYRAVSIITWDQDIPRWALSTVHALTRLIGIVPSFDRIIAGDFKQTRADAVIL